MFEAIKSKLDRRSFLTYLGIGGIIASALASVGATARFLFPQVFYEPSQRLKIGEAGDFTEGSINFLPDAKVFLHRSEKGFFAISSTCTHLGCIIAQTDDGFACPCHGSVFNKQGKVKGGPAPRALPWFELSLSPEGQLIVDRSRTVVEGTTFIA